VKLADDLRLEGERVFAVPFAERHLYDPAYLAWLRDYEVIRSMNLPSYWEPVAFETVKRYVEGQIASPTDQFFALYEKESERFIGTLRAAYIDWRTRETSLGILIGPREMWGRGLGSDAIRMLCRYLFDRVGLRRIEAGLMGSNQGMLRVFERCGFKLEGRQRNKDLTREGDYVDHLHLGLLKEEFDAALTAWR
jgi:RimJ/RimL family protein N-acetyltransferase